jgi:cytochrome c-type biogenesis protein CcmE
MRRVPHLKFLVAGALIVGTISFLMFSGIDNAMVYYYTVSEVQSQGRQLTGKGIRISGHVRPGSIKRTEDGTSVDFEVYERSSGQALQVSYAGLIPDTFKDDAEVVVEGVYDLTDPSFNATTLLAKCPSKYEGRADQHPEYIPVEKVSSAQ